MPRPYHLSSAPSSRLPLLHCSRAFHVRICKLPKARLSQARTTPQPCLSGDRDSWEDELDGGNRCTPCPNPPRGATTPSWVCVHYTLWRSA
ncbi:hypothetical protein GN956_G8470 [Arapaima gigas]